MKRFIKCFIAFFLFSAVIMLQFGGVYGVSAAPELIATIFREEEIALWHHSGGYWHSTKYNFTIQDSEVQFSVENLAGILGKYVEFSIPLPDIVKSAIAKGDIITVDYSVSGAADRFDESKGVRNC